MDKTIIDINGVIYESGELLLSVDNPNETAMLFIDSVNPEYIFIEQERVKTSALFVFSNMKKYAGIKPHRNYRIPDEYKYSYLITPQHLPLCFRKINELSTDDINLFYYRNEKKPF